MKRNYPYSRKTGLVIQDTESEILIYDTINNKAFCLNETSAFIWQSCDGNKSLTEIAKGLEDKLKSPADEGLVWLALEQLKKENLIENEVDVPTMFAGMSRREVIRKVGVGSMIALPIVSSLLAPSALHATSAGCAAGGNPVGSACNCPNATAAGALCAAPGVLTSGVSSGCANAACDCGGPFGGNNTGGTGQKRGTCR